MISANSKISLNLIRDIRVSILFFSIQNIAFGYLTINGSNRKIFNVIFPLSDFIIFHFVSTSMSLHVKRTLISASFNFEYKDIEDCTVFKCLYCKVK